MKKSMEALSHYNGGFTKTYLVDYLYERYKLTGYEITLLFYIARKVKYANDNLCIISPRKLMKRFSASESTFKRSIKRLRKFDLLEKYPRKGKHVTGFRITPNFFWNGADNVAKKAEEIRWSRKGMKDKEE